MYAFHTFLPSRSWLTEVKTEKLSVPPSDVRSPQRPFMSQTYNYTLTPAWYAEHRLPEGHAIHFHVKHPKSTKP